MFCLYTNTYIQLFAQIYILLYYLLKSKLSVFKLPTKGPLKLYLLWFGIFTLVSYLSKYWALTEKSDSNTMLTIFRILIIGYVIVRYANNREKTISLLLSFIYAFFFMSIIVVFLGLFVEHNIGSVQLGVSIGQHRNSIGAAAAPLVFICYYFRKFYGMKYGYLFSCYFLLVVLLSGSRGAFLQVVMLLVLCLLIGERKLTRIMRNILFILLLFCVGAIIIQIVPFLRENIWIRIENALTTVFGNQILDTSVSGRDYYRDIALLMFLSRPWLGYGIDGFYCFLRDNSRIMGVVLDPVYSHCNFAELAANYGVLGLVVWYTPMFYVLKRIFVVRKNSKLSTCVCSLFISMLVMDYARILWYQHLEMYYLILLILLCYYEFSDKELCHEGQGVVE